MIFMDVTLLCLLLSLSKSLPTGLVTTLIDKKDTKAMSQDIHLSLLFL